MAKTESTAVTEFINLVRGEMVGDFLPAQRQPLTQPIEHVASPPVPQKPTLLPNLSRASSPATLTAPAPLRNRARGTLPEPIRVEEAAEGTPAPTILAQSELIYSAELESAELESAELESAELEPANVQHNDTVPTRKVAPPAHEAPDIELDDWFDGDSSSGEFEESAFMPRAAMAISIDDSEFPDEMNLDRPARSRWGLMALGGLIATGGLVTAAIIAFSGGNSTPTARRATAAVAGGSPTQAAAPTAPAAPLPAAPTAPSTLAAPTTQATPNAPVAAAARPTSPTAPAGVVLRRATFTSEPAGATVTLMMNGKPIELGPAPVDAQLDPSKSYDVIFTKANYATVLQPVVFSAASATDGAGPFMVAATLRDLSARVTDPAAKPAAIASVAPKEVRETAAPAIAASPTKSIERAPKKTKRAKTSPKLRRRPAKRTRRSRKQHTRKAKKQTRTASRGKRGILMLNAKPPCDIYVDGRRTGKKTPQRALALSPGKHTIKLVNRRYKITKSFRVMISSGKKTRVIKDLTDRMR